MQLHFADHVVLAVYLAAMMFLGWRLARGQQTEEEYFLGGRRLPWFAVGVSIIASLLSSITYLASPGIVWRFGFGGFVSSLFAIPLDMILILLLAIPFFVRFKFTTAYEYLEHRYDLSVRLLGATMFLLFVTVLMGVIVLVSSRALAVATGLPLVVIIGVIGVVATVYTMMGGIRAVVWTDVIQVALLVGGGLFTVGYVAWVTGSGPLGLVPRRERQGQREFHLLLPRPHRGRHGGDHDPLGCDLDADGPLRQPDDPATLLQHRGRPGRQAQLRHQYRGQRDNCAPAGCHRRLPGLLLHSRSGSPPRAHQPGERQGSGFHLSLLRGLQDSAGTGRSHLRRPPGGGHVHHRLGGQFLGHRGHRGLRPAPQEAAQREPRLPGPGSSP